MAPRRWAALAALTGTVVIAGWCVVGSLGSPDPADADAAAGAVAAKGPLLAIPKAPGLEQEVLGVADAAVVDPSLLDPQPMLPSNDSSRQIAASHPPDAAANPPDPVRSFADDSVGSIRGSPAIAAVKHALAMPRLDRDDMFTPAHIAQIKASLNLTPEQEQHWTPVEAELCEIARQLAAQKASGKKKVAIDATEAQRLYWAAGPLIMSMSPEQKQEIRRIARAMGLAQVASLI
jgi:hypothetical protein